MERRSRRLMVVACLAFATVGGVDRLSGQGPAVPAPWASRDIGSPALAGTSSLDQASGTFSIDAAGSDIWGTADQFHFIYQPLAGDAMITARVDSLFAAHPWSKAGVMIRSSLTANASHAYALVSAGKGAAFQRRRSDGGPSVHTSGSTTAVAPLWVRLARSGSTVTASMSSNGTSWTTIGSDTVALGAIAYVGLAVTSHDAAQSTSAAVSSVTATATAVLPSPQQSRDIGSPAIAGSAAFSQGTYTVTAAGRDIGDVTDQFHYVYQPLTGDMDVSVRVVSLTGSTPQAKAGVMIRENLTAGSAQALAALSSDSGYLFQRRPTADGTSLQSVPVAGTPPGWVRLKRTADLITAYSSRDGIIWTPIGSDSFPMADTVYVGIAVTSRDASAVTTATLTNLIINQSQPANQPPTVTLTTPASGASFTAPASISLTATASDADGSVARVDFYNGTTLLGSDPTAPYAFSWSDVAAGTYSLRATAVDDAGASGSSATATITVTAPAYQLPTAWASRDIGSPGIAGAASFDQASGRFSIDAAGTDIWGTADQFHFVYQPLAGDAVITARVDSLFAAHHWSKAGVMIRSSLSADAAHAYALVSAGKGAAFQRRRSDGGLSVHTSGSTTAVAPLWLRLARSGSTVTASMSSNGTSWTTIGSGTIALGATAYVGLAVTSHDAAQSTSAAVSSVTTTGTGLPANQPPSVTLTAPADSATFTAPASITLTATASDADGTVARVDFYNGTTLLGSATTAPYAFTWSNVAAGTYSLRATAVDNAGASGSSATATVTVAPANQMPTATLTAPASGASFTAPATIALTATASDADGTVARVDFYNGTTLLGSDPTAPYGFGWSGVAAGTYALRAIAYDNVGASTTSATVTITVGPAMTTPTGIMFQASVDHTNVTSYLLQIFPNGSDPNIATPVATSDLGKPTPDANGDISVDRAALFSGLAPGTYILTVSSIGSGGSSRSASLTFTR